MAKGQQKSNREKRKPKAAAKPKGAVQASPFSSTSGGGSHGGGFGKKAR